jgi:hypothetical protein
MTGLVRKAILLGVCGVIFAAAASANVPDPAKSSAPVFIKVGGKTTTTGGPDPTIAFTITVRDFASNPIAGSNVQLNFGLCTDTKLCTATVGVNCTGGAGGTPIVAGLTNASGQVTFSVLGAAMNYGSAVQCPGSPVLCPGAGKDCIKIYADGVLLGSATSVDFDEDGATAAPPGGVNSGDLSKIKVDITAYGLVGATAYRGRSDLSAAGDYAVNSADQSFMKTNIASAGLGTGSGAGCVAAAVPQPYCP